MKKIIIFLCILFTISACSKTEEPQPSQAPAATTQRVEPIIVYEEKVVYNYDFKLDEVKDIPKEEDTAEIITAPRLFDYYNKELKPNKNYGELYVFAGGVATPCYDGGGIAEARYGLMNTNGQVVTEAVFSDVETVTAGEHSFYVLQYPMDSVKGRELSAEYREISSSREYRFSYEIPAGVRLELNDTVIASTDGSKAVTYSMVDAVYEFDGNIAVVYETAGTGALNYCVDMLDPKLEKVGSYTGGALEVGEPSEGLMAVKGDSFGCYIDNTAAVKVQTQSFYYMGPFCNGYACVWNWGEEKSAGETYRMHGYIDLTGKVVIPLEYYDAAPFNEYGYATVATREMYVVQHFFVGNPSHHDSVINKDNKVVYSREHTVSGASFSVYGNYASSADGFINLESKNPLTCAGCGMEWDSSQMGKNGIYRFEIMTQPYYYHNNCNGSMKIYTLSGKLLFENSNFSGYIVKELKDDAVIFVKDKVYTVYDINTGKYIENAKHLYIGSNGYVHISDYSNDRFNYDVYNIVTGSMEEDYIFLDYWNYGYSAIKENTAYAFNKDGELIFKETITDFNPLI